MGLETGTFINSLNAANPLATDPKSEGDDHIRLLKSTVKATFPNITGAVTPTQTELNYVVGVTSGIQGQFTATNASIAGKANKSGDSYTGTHDYTGATLNVPTAATAVSSTVAASTAYVQNAILASSGITASLPAQSGNAGKVLTTDGTTASWNLVSQNPVVLDYERTDTLANGGTPSLARVVVLDADRELVILSNGHAFAYNRTTKTGGAVVSFRALSAINVNTVTVSANQVLVASVATSATALEVVSITLSGTTCTVGTPATFTLAGNYASFGMFVAVGSTYVLSYNRATNVKGLLPMTLSGSTITLGSETALTGAYSTGQILLEAVSSSVLLAIHANSATTYASPYTVSGTTLTLGTEATVTLTSGTSPIRLGGALTSGRYFVASSLSSLVALASVTGTVASWSATATLTSGALSAGGAYGFKVGNGNYVVLRQSSTATSLVLLQDNAGTATIVSELTGINGRLSLVGTTHRGIDLNGRFLVSYAPNSATTPTGFTVTSSLLTGGTSGQSNVAVTTDINGDQTSTGVLTDGTRILDVNSSNPLQWFDGSAMTLVTAHAASVSRVSGNSLTSGWLTPFAPNAAQPTVFTSRLVRLP